MQKAKRKMFRNVKKKKSVCLLFLLLFYISSDGFLHLVKYPKVIYQCMCSLLFANVCVPCYLPMYVFPVICQCMCSLLLANVCAPCYFSNVCAPCYLPMYMFPVIFE